MDILFLKSHKHNHYYFVIEITIEGKSYKKKPWYIFCKTYDIVLIYMLFFKFVLPSLLSPNFFRIMKELIC